MRKAVSSKLGIKKILSDNNVENYDITQKDNMYSISFRNMNQDQVNTLVEIFKKNGYNVTTLKKRKIIKRNNKISTKYNGKIRKYKRLPVIKRGLTLNCPSGLKEQHNIKLDIVVVPPEPNKARPPLPDPNGKKIRPRKPRKEHRREL